MEMTRSRSVRILAGLILAGLLVALGVAIGSGGDEGSTTTTTSSTSSSVTTTTSIFGVSLAEPATTTTEATQTTRVARTTRADEAEQPTPNVNLGTTRPTSAAETTMTTRPTTTTVYPIYEGAPCEHKGQIDGRTGLGCGWCDNQRPYQWGQRVSCTTPTSTVESGPTMYQPCSNPGQVYQGQLECCPGASPQWQTPGTCNPVVID